MQLEIALCKRDPVHFINQWVYGHDPRESASYVPFDLFPKQAEFVEWMIAREESRTSGLSEKSRDGGITTLGAAYGAHGLLFREGFRMGFGSQKLEYVDHLGDPKSIFEKIRFILRQLPEWMMPKGWVKVLAQEREAAKISLAEHAAAIGEWRTECDRLLAMNTELTEKAAIAIRKAEIDTFPIMTTIPKPPAEGRWKLVAENGKVDWVNDGFAAVLDQKCQEHSTVGMGPTGARGATTPGPTGPPAAD